MLIHTVQIGHVTYNNASNNSTMMQEFSMHLTTVNNRVYNPQHWKIKCVHLSIVLSFFLIGGISVVLHTLSTWPPNALSHHTVTPLTLTWRILRCTSQQIVMRWDWWGWSQSKWVVIINFSSEIWFHCSAQSSSKQKEIWRTIQAKASVTQPVQLALNMKVQWSSTYVMLDVTKRNQAVNTDPFVLL